MDPLLRDAIMKSPWAWALVVALGLAVGSFVNVLIWRLPREESILRPRSRCPGCGSCLRWYHNIPAISWLMLRGRCAFCRAPIRWTYPAVEVICAGLFVAFFARYGPTVSTLAFWYLAAILIAVFFIDWEFQIIPNELTYTALVVGLGTSFISPHITWVQSLTGAAIGFGGFLGLAYLGRWLFKKESMGGGDIKLAAAMGAFLGTWKILLVFILSAAIGLAISLVVMAFSASLRKHRIIPFGPSLALAAIVAGFWGQEIIRFYLAHFVGQ
jgi:leader peptidase (prepilin peptidase)/N-methyltransferase